MSRFALIGVIGGGTAACTSDASRLGDPFTNPFSSMSGEPSATGSLAETDAAPPPVIRTPRIQTGELGAPSPVMSPRPAMVVSEPISGNVAGMNPDASRMSTPRIAPAAPAPRLEMSAAPKLVDRKAVEAEARKLAESRKLVEAEARKQAEIDAKKEVEARKVAEAKKLIDAKKAAESKAAELKAVEAKKLAEAVEAKKLAEAKAAQAAEAKKLAEAKKSVDSKKLAEAEAKKALDAKKLAEAEAKKAAEAKKLAEAEAKKAADAKKLAEAEAKKAQAKLAAKPDPAAERKLEAARKAEAEAKLAKAEAAKEAARKVAEAKAAEAAAKEAAREAAKVASKEGAKDQPREPKIADREPEKPATVKVASADPISSPATASDASESFRWPAKGRVINGYGSGNEGINISVPEGTPVKAAEDGTVAYAGSDVKGYGKLVLVRHNNGYVSAYAHNGELDVRPGEKVKRGQTIAKSGATGNVTSPQLHFEIRKGATPVDPIPHLASN